MGRWPIACVDQIRKEMELVFSAFKRKPRESTHAASQQPEPVVEAISRSMAVIEFTPEGTVISANDNFLRVVGYDAQEVVGQHHTMFCDEAYAKSREYQQLWEQLKSGQYVEGRFKRVTKSGDTVWLRATYNPVYETDGSFRRIVKIASDISDTVQHEAEVQGKLDALSRSTAIVEFEPDGTIVDCNENFLSAVRYRREDIVGKHHRMFCDPEYTESAEYRQFWAKLNEGQFANGLFKRVDGSGNVLWLEASYNPVFDSEGRLYRIVKFASDVTESTLRAEAERSNASTAYRISRETLKASEENGALISDTVSEIHNICASLKESWGHLDNLNKQSSEINSIINTIEQIANQTNLLALNAAIEAARAGDNGRGFSVVADEVRHLSSRTAQSTAEISTMINRIQEGTCAATSSMEECLSQANRGVELAVQSGEAVGKIQDGAKEVVAAVDQFSNALE